MIDTADRRTEQRLRYNWPVWFAPDLHDCLCQGQMVDLSSSAAAFTCQAEGLCPAPGQEVTARFSVPRFSRGDSFQMANFTRKSTISRVEQVNDYTRRITVQFAAPLPFKPGEQKQNKPNASRGILAAAV